MRRATGHHYAGLAPVRRRCGRATIQLVCRSVLIVDDHAEFRRTLRELLEAEGFRVVGEAADGKSALLAAGRLQPRIVVLDIQLPDLDGFEVAARLADGSDPPAVILTSTRDTSAYRRRLANTPAVGFIVKSELSGEALAALGA
jgi:DNA-binding NarL/FixJ family response regulator